MAALTMSALAQSTNAGDISNSNNDDAKIVKFDVISIRPSAKDADISGPKITPDGLTATASLATLIQIAYNPLPPRYWSGVLHLPSWAKDTLYNVDARVADADLKVWQAQDGKFTSVVRSALQDALTERCGLTVKVTSAEAPYIDLIVGKHGAQLVKSQQYDAPPFKDKRASKLGKGFNYDSDGVRHYFGISMSEFVLNLERIAPGNLFQDKTGLEGRYDFSLPIYEVEDHSAYAIYSPLDRIPVTKIGLNFRSGKGPSYVLDLMSIRKPDPN
jgi:uncharacterized protein (TIGR03435 family)